MFILNIKKEIVRAMKRVRLRIEELLEERNISKNTICRDVNLPRGNFNRYCRGEFQRIDTGLIIKLCEYFDIEIAELIEIVDN